jgi:hypothetical protein
MLCSLPLVRWEARMRKVMVAIVTLRKGNLKPCLFLTPRELILQFLDFLGSSGTWLMVCRRRRWHLYHVNIKRPMVTRLTDTCKSFAARTAARHSSRLRLALAAIVILSAFTVVTLGFGGGIAALNSPLYVKSQL